MRQVKIAPNQKIQWAQSTPAMQEQALAILWRARGLEDRPDYALNTLLPPKLLGIDAAVARLEAAIAGNERVLVVGDFDADGATATALAVSALQAMGLAQVDWRIPDRFAHGYGLSAKLVKEIGVDPPDLLLTVDQGIGSMEGVALAKELGMDVIVTDHHLPGQVLPNADAIVNPNLPQDPFPSKHLAGVGVVFYLMVALRQHLRQQGHFDNRSEPRLDQWLDLVALGTVADLVTLDHNNRVLVAQGLERIRHGQTRPGIGALLEVAGRNLRHISAADLGFAIAPRLNAAGRLEDMSLGVRCLLAENEPQARRLAKELDDINQARKSLQATMQTQANEQAKALISSLGTDLPGACLFDPSWHQGVVGLVAGQVAERVQRPVVAFAPDESGSAFLKGSARSPAGIHMRDLLVELDTNHPGLIERFGGHAGAAGLTIKADRLPRFEAAFDRLVQAIEHQPLALKTDGSLPEALLSAEFAQLLDGSGPWGQGFPEPLFDGLFDVVDRRVVGGEHLKLQMRPHGSNQVLDAIAFRAGALCHQELPKPWHVTYRLTLNRWRGQVRIQLNVQHWVEGVLRSE